MTTQQIKEQVGKHLFFMIASQMGCKISELYLDNGVDFMLIPVEIFDNTSKTRMLDSGSVVAIQLKCTTEKSIIRTKDGVKYDIEVKSFNDLIYRRKSRHGTKGINIPLVLVLVVFSNEKDYLFSFDGKTLEAKSTIYWFYPKKEDKLSLNSTKTRIFIPKGQEITFENFHKIFTHDFNV